MVHTENALKVVRFYLTSTRPSMTCCIKRGSNLLQAFPASPFGPSESSVEFCCLHGLQSVLGLPSQPLAKALGSASLYFQ